LPPNVVEELGYRKSRSFTPDVFFALVDMISALQKSERRKPVLCGFCASIGGANCQKNQPRWWFMT